MAKDRGRIRLWELGSGLPLGEIRAFLKETFGPALSCPPPKRLVPDQRLPAVARSLLPRRVLDPGRLGQDGARPTRKEQDALVRILGGSAEPSERLAGPVSGIGLASALGAAIPSRFAGGNADLVFTGALPVMWEPSDCRYHARALVCAFPSIISTTGAVEGPARPRAMYVARMMGITDDEARRKYIGRYLEHGDGRLAEAAKGLAAQAVFYHLTGQPFCEREDCRLFNARWQEQLVAAQVKSARFCEQHGRFLKELRRQRAKG
jgi:hypothetical protein